MQKASNLYKLHAPGSPHSLPGVPQRWPLASPLYEGSACREAATIYSGEWAPIVSVATQELGCLGAEEKDGTGENGLDTESICKPRPTSYPTVP